MSVAERSYRPGFGPDNRATGVHQLLIAEVPVALGLAVGYWTFRLCGVFGVDGVDDSGQCDECCGIGLQWLRLNVES